MNSSYAYCKESTEPGEDQYAEQGRWIPTETQLKRAVKTLVEVVDCVGDQLRGTGDRAGALYAALLLRYLRTSRATQFANDPRWSLLISSSLEAGVAGKLNQALGNTKGGYTFEGMERLFKDLAEVPFVTEYLKTTETAGDIAKST